MFLKKLKQKILGPMYCFAWWQFTLSLVNFSRHSLAFLRILLLSLHFVHLLRAFLAVILLRLCQQLLVLILGHVHHRAQVFLELPMMLHVVPLVLEELDDGVFGEIQLSRKSVDGFLVRVQAHIMDEALEDPEGFQRDLCARPRLFGATVFSRRRWGRCFFSGRGALLGWLRLLSMKDLIIKI